MHRLLDVIDDEESGFPPCLVFERGGDTLDQWIEKADPDAFMKKAVLLQVRS